MHLRYRVAKLQSGRPIDAAWDATRWDDVHPVTIAQHMGPRPDHFPRAEVKVGWDEHGVSVIYRVEDRFVRAVTDKYQGRVFEDSCVEFFFTPDGDSSRGYFNLEVNCGGTALFHFHPASRPPVHIDESDFREIQIAHSMPDRIEPEITTPVTWTLECRIPITLIQKYFDCSLPARGNLWRANFYKCGDKTSHPHWLTWARVESPEPQFHLPAFFGVLEFI